MRFIKSKFKTKFTYHLIPMLGIELEVLNYHKVLCFEFYFLKSYWNIGLEWKFKNEVTVERSEIEP
jgi:hypothetical protein